MINKDLLANKVQIGNVSKKDRFCQKLHVKYLSDKVAAAKQAVREAKEVMYEATRISYAAFMDICSLELDDSEETMKEGVKTFEYLCDVANSDECFMETELRMQFAQKAFKVAVQVLKEKKKELKNYRAQVKHCAK